MIFLAAIAITSLFFIIAFIVTMLASTYFLSKGEDE